MRESRPLVPGDGHPVLLPFCSSVDSEQLHDELPDEGYCPACRQEMYAHEVERNQPV